MGPCPAANISSSPFYPTGLFETLGTISCVLRPVSPLSQLPCQMPKAADLTTDFSRRFKDLSSFRKEQAAATMGGCDDPKTRRMMMNERRHHVLI
ncbi:hypothetical protein AVEN_128797-1 [Araneus ventricosus]|uniref:Uncharacterized protein n=2 Tax=Araneus ventricosus TaxID=182803 RepID=A0A4Y2UZT4_ARAVE|nr:hypothetical protein AVEN_91028-1 [Araneus ventricosus]GBO17761.1 hypothetical protein AVEN_128797-1 [Araneus ventricosus]